MIAAGAIPAERTAAEELARYLQRISGASFTVRDESPDENSSPAIHVGPTAVARAVGCDPALFPAEGWRVRTAGGHLILAGGRPRGTLYAVYHFLEDELGVRWWNAFEEQVPRSRRLTIGAIDRAGRPAFGYRDVNGLYHNAPDFSARSRLNGHESGLGRAHGGSERYGPPSPCHTCYQYAPPEELFAQHPEFYAEIDGVRVHEDAQLCLTNPALLDLVTARLRANIGVAKQTAELRGEDPPTLFDFSANDDRGSCECANCRSLAQREGSDAAPLVAFVGALAGRIANDDPGVRLDTLAYLDSFDPPSSLTFPDNVIVRLSALQYRNWAQPVTAPENVRVREALAGWRRVTGHLRVWDYLVTFGRDGDLPLPDLAWLAADLRYYAEHGVQGLYIQQDYEISAHLRDLELWVLTRLLEDPYRDSRALVTEFTDGFYGRAGDSIRRYLAALEAALARRPSRVGYPARADQFAWLDHRFLVEAQGIFDRAARAVRGRSTLERRVRHARLSLDRATLELWKDVGLDADRGPLDPIEIATRYRRTWLEQIALRGPRTEKTPEEADRHAARLLVAIIGER